MRVLGIDYGARRIGLALSDATATLASPWRLLQRPPSEAETLRIMIKEIDALAKDDDGLEAVVVGWPRRLDGSPTHQTEIVETFARALEAQIAVPVVLQDERLSSHEAESRLAAREVGLAQAQGQARRRGRGDHPAGLSGWPPLAADGRARTNERWIKRLFSVLVVLVADRAAPAAGGCIRRSIEPYRGYDGAEVFVDIPSGSGPEHASASGWSAPASCAMR